MNQWKLIYLAKRNPALRPEDFPQAWREHSALGRQCRNVQDKVKVVRQCSRVLTHSDLPRGASEDYDGVNLLSLRDRQAAQDIWTDEETLQIMRPDELRVFSSYVRDFTLLAQEQLLRDGAETGICLLLFLRGHAKTSLCAPELGGWSSSPWGRVQRLVWNEVTGERPRGYHYDAIVEAWFETLDDIAAAFGKQSVWAQLPSGLSAQIEASRSVCLLTAVTHRRP